MDHPPDYTRKAAQRGLGLQCAIAITLGCSSLIAFSIWRRRWPRLYAARTFRRPELPAIDRNLFGWIWVLHRTTDRQVLEYAGLDAFVYLKFFQAAIVLFSRLAIISFLVIGPLRWYYLGKYEDDDDDTGARMRNWKRSSGEGSLFGDFLGVYFVFTYVFTIICFKIMRQFTNEVVAVRQQYLGHQNSITDRTLRITGIPKRMRSREALSTYLTRLFHTEPHAVLLCRDWSVLDQLGRHRRHLVRHLERLWAQYVGIRYKGDPDTLPPAERRPMGRPQLFRGPKVDLIDYYSVKLASLDAEIKRQRGIADDRAVMSSAFVTMKSVADCQMAAQALLSPRPHALIATLAPAPHDVVWRNLYMPPRRRSFQNYAITFVVLLSGAFLVIPVTYLASFLDMDTIAKFSPRLSEWMKQSVWLATFMTEVAPTFVYTFFNMVIPYFYAFLSEYQGYVSREDVELSTVTKNFFYVFVNLFLVFTISKTYLSTTVVDTTKIAKGFADSLLNLSTFYTNLIVLQGIGLMPLKLLQAGSVLQFPFFAAGCRSARDYHELYKPSTLNYGILLPTPLLIFIVVLSYSILRKRIVFFGLVYFVLGYYVAKYQFMYSMVHPQHSNGRLWTLIMRRVYLGIGMFLLAMVGVLVLETQYTLAVLLLPLVAVLAAVWYDFEHFTEPLLRFIAIEALHHPLDDSDSDSEIDDDSELSADVEAQRPLQHRASRTLDEDRELHLRYVNRNTVMPLDGPWVGVDGTECILADADNRFVRKLIDFEDWS